MLGSHDPPPDLHISEIDRTLEHTRHIGILSDHTSVSPDNVAQMSPRLHRKITLAIADAR